MRLEHAWRKRAVAAVVLAAMAAMGALAMESAQLRLINSVTTGSVRVAVLESALDADSPSGEKAVGDGCWAKVDEGAAISRIARVKNTGDVAAWVRIRPQICIQASDGSRRSAEVAPSFSMSLDGWTMQDDDGWAYCETPLAPQQVSPPALDSLAFPAGSGAALAQGEKYVVMLEAQGVQQRNNGSIVTEAQGWPSGFEGADMPAADGAADANGVRDDSLPLVVYDAETTSLECYASEGSDLFGAFKGVLPGDVLTQRIRLEVRNAEAPVRMYVQADSSAASDALEGARMLVEGDCGVVQEGALGDCFSNRVLLAEFQGSEQKILEVTLSLPASLDNRAAGVQMDLPWVVTVEDEGVDGDAPDVSVHSDEAKPLPQTGDHALRCLSGIAVVALALSIGVMLKRIAGL